MTSGSAVASVTAPSPFQQGTATLQNFQNNLNAGALTYQYPFSLPPGPGGFVPPLTLSYSSAAVNQDYNLQADAPWVGEGWSLDVGAITWSEENETSGCQAFDQSTLNPPTTIPDGWMNCNPAAIGGGGCPGLTGELGVTDDINCTNEWANSWTITLNGQSTPLIPQNTDWGTGPDAILWSGLNRIPPGDIHLFNVVTPPQQWYTAPESHAKIIELSCTTKDLQGNPWTHPCWRVWLPSGEMLEFGATDDSVEYGLSEYVDWSSNPAATYLFQYAYNWKLDAMVDSHGNQIHLGYHQYTGLFEFSFGNGQPDSSLPYVQDAELASISYDSPTCVSTATLCSSGSSAPALWQPLVQVVFDQGIAPTRLTGGDSACQGWDPSVGMRCDEFLPGVDIDPVTRTSFMTNVAVLNAIEVQARPNATSPWGLLRAYALSYEQTAAIHPVGAPISSVEGGCCAGYLDLTKIQQFGTDWTGDSTNTGTSLPAMAFSYLGSPASGYLTCHIAGPCTDDSVLQEHYIGPLYQAPQGFNEDHDPACVLWDSTSTTCDDRLYQESYNQRYLAEVDNGAGVQETFTWQEGHMNVEGVPAGRSVTNPFSCTASDMSTLPCSRADAQHWSRILLVARDAKVQTTIGGATVTVDHHWSYVYAMTAVQSQNSWCAPGDCQAVWDWGDVDDGDYLDFYNAEFWGFHQVQVVEQEVDSGGGACTTSCTLSVTNHTYITTQGWGVWNLSEFTFPTPTSPYPLPSAYSCPNVIIYGASGDFPPSTYPTPIVTSCPNSPYWSSSNMPAGAETQTDESGVQATC